MSLYESKTYIEDLHTALKCSIGIGELKNKRLLITGATGTIGSFLIDMLIEYNKHGADIKIYATGRSIERLKNRFNDVESNLLEYVEYDIQSPIKFYKDVDYIIHAAGNAHPDAFNSDPVGTIIGNIYGTYNLLEYGRKNGAKRFCYISSGEVYGIGDINLDSFDESYGGYIDSVSSRSCYPNSKRTAETLCVSYSKEYGLETVIVRPCHTYGPGLTDNDSRANAQFFRKVINGENIVMKSTGQQMRSYCYVADCASIIMTALLKGESGQAYNSANSQARTTIAALAKEIAEAAGKKVIFENPSMVDIAKQTPIPKQVLSSNKIESLGWKGNFTIKKGIEHMLAILNGE